MTPEQFAGMIKQLSAIVIELHKLNMSVEKIVSAQTGGNRKAPPPTSLVDPTKRPGS
jgi:hypothetical protein